MTAPLLSVRDLHTHFQVEGKVAQAVAGVSFDVMPGEFLGIVGESGSGKSVTALSILRLVPDPPGRIVKGEVWFRGQDLTTLSWEALRAIRGRDVAMIFQEPMTSLNPVFTIGMQIAESVRHHRNVPWDVARERAVEVLEDVGIPDPRRRLDDYPHQFSGGMRQRVMIAMALANRPSLLIADEPTTALDVTIQAQILELINRLRDELDTAVIMITHDLGVVAGMTDRVTVMYAGKVVEEGSTKEIFANPRMPYTIGLLRSIPRLDEERGRKLTPIRGLPPSLVDLPAICPFSPRCDYAQEQCLSTAPGLRAVGSDHNAACHFDITLSTPIPEQPTADVTA